MRVLVCLLALSGLSAPVLAETPADFLAAYAQEAKTADPAFRPPFRRARPAIFRPNPWQGVELHLLPYPQSCSCRKTCGYQQGD